MKKYVGTIPLILSILMLSLSIYSRNATTDFGGSIMALFLLVILLIIIFATAGLSLAFQRERVSNIQSVIAIFLSLFSIIFWYVYRAWG